MGNNIRSSSRPKALAPSIPMPPLADAMDAVHLSVDRFCLLAGVPQSSGGPRYVYISPKMEPHVVLLQSRGPRNSSNGM